MFSMVLSAQNYYPRTHFTGKVTPVLGVGGENSYVDVTANYGLQVSGGVGYLGNFFGIGLGFEGFTEHDNWGNTTGFNLPLFAQYTYTPNHSGYTFDLKIGPSFYTYDNYTATGFYLNVTPIGYQFDEHNSFGLGYRYMHLYDVNCHSAQVSYTYTF